jgi:D-3-phosphoglycerate dehydrogenase
MEKKMFAEHGIELVTTDIENEEDYVAKCKDADAILIVFAQTPKNVIDRLEKCKVMVRYGVGYDVIDVDACTKKGIAVCNIPDYCAEEVAAHAAALALDCLRKITIYDRTIHAGKWNGNAGYPISRLSSLTFGLCGFGNIARTAAKFMKGFGFNMIAYDPYLGDDVFAAQGVKKVDLEELCKTSDIISVHVPLSKETNHLIAKPQFDMMKKGVIIINTSRGGLVCQEDLLDAVDAGIVKAAGLDVLETEPITDPNERILKYDNIILTPHAAAQGVEAIGDLRVKVVETAVKVIKGELPFNVINKKELQAK